MLVVAEVLWDAQETWDRAIRDRMVEDLLEVKNGSWLDEGEAELSASAFLTRVKLDDVSIDAEAGFSFWFDDGGLFWGHAIAVRGTLSDGVQAADICG